MDKLDELNKAKGLLTQALSVALNSMPNNRSVQDARMHMKKALNELDNAAKTQIKRRGLSEQQFKNWWGNVVQGTSAVAAQPMSPIAQQRSLEHLNSMISEESKKLEELEKQSEPVDAADQVFND